jgi:hypothetical protein
MSEGRTSARERHVYRPLLVLLCAAMALSCIGVLLIAVSPLAQVLSERLYCNLDEGPEWLTYSDDRSYGAGLGCEEDADAQTEAAPEEYSEDPFAVPFERSYASTTVAVEVTTTVDEAVIELTWRGRSTHPIFQAVSTGEGDVSADDLAYTYVAPGSDLLTDETSAASEAVVPDVFLPTGEEELESEVEESARASLDDSVATVVIERHVALTPGDPVSVDVETAYSRFGRAPTVGPVTIQANDGRTLLLTSWSERPTTLTSEQATWEVLDDDDLVGVSIDPALASAGARARGEASSAGSFLVDWGHERNPRWLWEGVHQVLALLPFIAGSLLVRRRATGGPRMRRGATAVFDMLLLLQAVPGLVLGLSEILVLLDRPLGEEVGQLSARVSDFGSFDVQLFRNSTWIASLCVFLVVWPLVVSGAWRAVRSSRPLLARRRVPRTASVLLAVVTVGVLWSFLLSNLETAAWVVAAAGLVLAWMVAGIAYGLGRPPLTAALAVPCVAILSVATLYFILLPNSLDDTVSVVSSIAAAGVIVAALLGAVVVVAHSYSPGAYDRVVARARANPMLTAVAGLFLVVAIVYLVVPREPHRAIPLYSFDAVSLGTTLREYLPYLLFAAVLGELHRASEARVDARPWGILLTVAVLFETTASFWIVPVVGLLGLLAMVLVLSRAIEPGVDAPLGVRADRLATLFSLRRDEKVAARAESAARERIASGETTIEEAMAKAAQLRASIDARLLRAGSVTIDELDHAATGMGPGRNAWESGWIGALCSIVLGLPWIVLYAQEVLDRHVGRGYVGLTIVVGLLAVALKWVAIGFVLGYFHAHLRGRTAVWKGLSFGIAIVDPWLVFAAIWLVPGGEETWGSFALWAGQTLIHCVAIGVALEWVLVRRTVGSATVLVDLRSFRPLVTYASGLLAAIGATVVTVVTGEVQNVLKTGISVLVPDEDKGPGVPSVGTGPQSEESTTPDAVRIFWPPELQGPGD